MSTIKKSVAETISDVTAGKAMLVDVRLELERASSNLDTQKTLHMPLQALWAMRDGSIPDEWREFCADLTPAACAKKLVDVVRTAAARHNGKIYCICNSGRRSEEAAQIFRDLGCSETYSVDGGVEDLAAIIKTDGHT